MTTASANLPSALTPRWYALRYHKEQVELIESEARFRVAYAGRRSGKTERAKRFLVSQAIMFDAFPDGRFFALGPTNEQTVGIWWEDLKALVPDWAFEESRERSISEGSPKTIYLWNGARIMVRGMDRPIRIEGLPIDGAICDEFADWKGEAWQLSLRPTLSTPGRPGWCWFIGKPRGRNHYFRLVEKARADTSGRWSVHNWSGETILDKEEVEALREDLDPLSYQQEVLAKFINFEGRAYYQFDLDVHKLPAEQCKHDPNRDLMLCFDFNVDPGVAVAVQEDARGTVAIGEVFIPRNSNTPAVCRKLLADYGEHKGHVYCYGDATGGARGSAKVAGSDWDLVRDHLRPRFGDRLHMRVPPSNPAERARVNSVNSRLKSMSGKVQLWVSSRCRYLLEDLDGVRVLEGGSGEIDKKADPMMSHISDALGYYVVRLRTHTAPTGGFNV